MSAPIYTQFEPWMSVNINNLDLHFTYCYKSQWMEIIPVPTCCKLHFHNYTCIPIFLGRRGTPYPTGQLLMVFSVLDVCIQHDQLLWCFQYQTYVYSMVSYYGVFIIRPIHDCVQQVQLLSPAMAKPLGGYRNARRPSVRPSVRASVRPFTKLVSAITSDFMHRFTQYLTQWCISP